MPMETMQRILNNDDIHAYLNFVRSHIGPSLASLLHFATKADALASANLSLVVAKPRP